MSINENVERLIEERTLEARKKQISEKCLKILENIGRDIMHEGFDLYEGHDWYNPDLIVDSESEGGHSIGKYYDFLSSGVNIQIKHESQINLITIYYDGYLVYHDDDNQLKTYVPNKEWEYYIEKYHGFAVNKGRNRKLAATKQNKEESKGKMKKLKDYLLEFWGYDFDN